MAFKQLYKCDTCGKQFWSLKTPLVCGYDRCQSLNEKPQEVVFTVPKNRLDISLLRKELDYLSAEPTKSQLNIDSSTISTTAYLREVQISYICDRYGVQIDE